MLSQLAAIEYSDIFGKLTLQAFKHDAIEASVGIGMIIAALITAFFLTIHKHWGWLWKEWLTSLDHKKIGMMYLIVSALSCSSKGLSMPR